MLLFTTALLWPISPVGTAQQATAPDHLRGETVLLIRHAEKPESGANLTAQGEARVLAYIRYFEPFRQEGEPFRVDALYAGTDSANSNRPRLTLEPLAAATHLKLNTAVGTKIRKLLSRYCKARSTVRTR